MITNRLISKELRDIADRIDDGTCGVDDEEGQMIYSAMMNRKMNIEKICQTYGISRATLNRWQNKGKLPPFRKDSGGKDYLFSLEIEESLKRWNSTHENDDR